MEKLWNLNKQKKSYSMCMRIIKIQKKAKNRLPQKMNISSMRRYPSKTMMTWLATVVPKKIF